MPNSSLSSHFGALKRFLKRFAWLRSGVYLVYEIKKVVLDSGKRDQKMCDRDFETLDPFDCLSDLSGECYEKQLQALDSVRDRACFRRALEIGCAEGVFTELLASRCENLLAVDLSAVAPPE